MDDLTRHYGSGNLRITSRQTFQIHCILKHNLKSIIAAVNAALLDTFATSGDVNRNVICSSNPMPSQHHAAVLEWARTLSDYLLPKTHAYHELWLDSERVDPADRARAGLRSSAICRASSRLPSRCHPPTTSTCSRTMSV